jgi:hypothetical protein
MSASRTYGSAACALAAAFLVSTLAPHGVYAHGTEARYVEIADWKKPNFARTFATNRAHIGSLPNRAAMTELGTTPPPQQSPRARNLLQKLEIEGQKCIFSDIMGFDVDDGFAFDIDEPITFTITYVPELSSQFIVAWDRNGGTGEAQTVEITPPATGPKLQTVSFPMDRARLAGQGVQGSDIAIAARNGFVLCDVKIERSNTTKPATAHGTVKLTIKDAETGALVPARVGLYDSTGRAPLASDDALMLQRFADDLRMLPVNDRTFWPSANRQAFYVDSEYEAEVPVGTYELVATRGLEFRAFHGTVEVKANQTSSVAISLERHVNMPAKGWYSGDAHIHLTRDKVADPTIWGMVAAEDVYVGNLLEMGNISGTHFKQPAEWGRASRFERHGHFILSGQEDPRTWFLGHTIHHNLQTPIHAPPSEYFLYHKVFDESHRQGGVSGFAHAGWGQRGADPAQMDRGMALLAPFGSVDFIEVLQGGRLTSDGWYQLLNLGLRVSPAAGSDWPYTDFPGVVRNYVKLDGPLNLDRWFESFRAGHTYVTNGPLVEFTVNGQPMGSEIRVKKGAKVDIVASADLNPDVDDLDRLEIVVLGDVAHSAAAKGQQASLKQSIVAERSMWIAARAFGARAEPRNTVIGHTAPIYVVVDDEPTWKAEAVPEIVAGARAQLQKLLVEQIDSTNDLEYWETRRMLADEWLTQRPLLKPRVAEADRLYQAMLDKLATFTKE